MEDQDKLRELTDAELDAVSGGDGSNGITATTRRLRRPTARLAQRAMC
jgi:hypothetical protein